MAFNIASFKSRFDGGARPTLFDVHITFPDLTGVPDNPTDGNRATEYLTFTCRAASIPEDRISPIEVPYFGRKIKVEGNRDYADWRVTIINDERYTVRTALEAWHQKINSIVPNRMSPDLWSDGSYKRTALVRQYRRAGGDAGAAGNSGGDIVRTYRIEGLFPTTIGEIRLGWSDVNQIEEYQVDFALDWWVPTIGESEVATDQGVLIENITS